VLHHTAADYAASTALALRAGLDVIFQSGAKDAALFWPPFKDGRIPPATIDSAVARVLRLKFRLGLFDRPYADTKAPRQDAASDDDALAGIAASESLVLLRNQRGTLPLSKETARIALIGEDANVVAYGGYTVPPVRPVRWIGGLVEGSGGTAKVEYAVGPRRHLDSFVPVTNAMLRTDTTRSAAPGLKGEYFSGIALDGAPATTRVDPQVDFSWTFNRPARGLGTDWYSIRWTGFVSLFPRANPRLAVEGDDGFRLWIDGALVIDAWTKTGYGRRDVTLRADTGGVHALRLEYRQSTGNGRVRLLWDNGLSAELAMQADSTQTAQAVAAAQRADAAVIVVGVDEGEFRDRASLRLTDRQEALIERIAATGKPTIVVLHTGGAVVMTPWIDKAGAVLLAPYPGPTAALAVGEALFGIRSPAGRLPFTVPRSEGQLPLVYDHLPTGRGDDYIDLTGQPLFPFGFGLSYSDFGYTGLQLSSGTASARDTVHVRFTITNAGPMASDEVPQLYVRHVTSPTAQPVLSLRGFARVPLQPGERRVIDLPLAVADLAVRDLDGRRRVVPGEVILYVGASSRDIRLRGTLTIK
jgi:beta-glucosidase